MRAVTYICLCFQLSSYLKRWGGNGIAFIYVPSWKSLARLRVSCLSLAGCMFSSMVWIEFLMNKWSILLFDYPSVIRTHPPSCRPTKLKAKSQPKDNFLFRLLNFSSLSRFASEQRIACDWIHRKIKYWNKCQVVEQMASTSFRKMIRTSETSL